MSIPPAVLQPALTAWTQLLGPERCLHGDVPRARAYADDVGEYARRAISAVLYPATALDVQSIVRIANQYGIPLYSLSTGKNWGMGSRQPVGSHGVIVDLQQMAGIRALDLDEGHVIVEPGVTQQDLSDALASTPYIANFTASTPGTSLVGNVLDKGIGLHRHRVDDLLGLEVVTGYGELVHVGGYWPTGRQMFHFPSGLGPTLTALFLQSNFAIVTACALRLIPRPEALHVAYATVPEDRLTRALAVLRELRAQHALDTVVKLYNAQAFHAYSGRQASADDRTFHLVAALHGSERWVRHVAGFVADALGRARCFDNVAVLAPEALATAPELVQALARTLGGTPTHFAVQRAFGLRDSAECRDVDRASSKGLIFVIPIVRLAGAAVGETLAVLGSFSKRYEVPINATINIVSAHGVEMVSSVMFSRTPEHIDRAHRLKQELLGELARRAIPLIRLDIDAQSDCEIFAEKSYKDLLIRLKELFDPNNVIAPGRYIPRV